MQSRLHFKYSYANAKRTSPQARVNKCYLALRRIVSNQQTSIVNKHINNITVFCGANAGSSAIYQQQAQALGAHIAKRGARLIYGGGRVGLMGILADAVLAHGAEAIGVIPDFLQTKEIAHPNLTQTIIVSSMHERKMAMYNMTDAVIALPGGFGTMDELFEMLTWAQLGMHQKPIVLLNINNYYHHSKLQIGVMIQEGFLKADYARMIMFADTIEDAFTAIETFNPPDVEKWITPGKE